MWYRTCKFFLNSDSLELLHVLLWGKWTYGLPKLDVHNLYRTKFSYVGSLRSNIFTLMLKLVYSKQIEWKN